METFDQFKEHFKLIAEDTDTEQGHASADSALMQIALNTTLTSEERIELVELYNSIDKWYA